MRHVRHVRHVGASVRRQAGRELGDGQGGLEPLQPQLVLQRRQQAVAASASASSTSASARATAAYASLLSLLRRT